ncbi:hypothetical protein E2C01_032863 [Portunus trituberculatus]|uniref:Uncharacterized protein n=1 Tax=Portunus trituberculatus TaxID=210409 RepID=A0A5B7EWC5_PORTR|nr:hypothetical protein [Portunus trituberculatus]
MLECEKYERDRHEMMQVILSELGHNRNERVEKTGREWMVLLLGLCSETSERMMEAVKEYLERMWRARSRRSKGLALERSRATCSIKIKIKRVLFGSSSLARSASFSSLGGDMCSDRRGEEYSARMAVFIRVSMTDELRVEGM